MENYWKILATGVLVSLWCSALPAYAWGDEGHEVVALIAVHYLDPGVKAKVDSVLAGDTTHLTPTTEIDQEATWADKYRASSTAHREATRTWHFVNLEISGPPDLRSACFGEPVLPVGEVASAGPAEDCVVDKIDEFTAELMNPATGKTEQLLALQFLLHFVGDVHQPLHSSDDHDAGGNRKSVAASGLAASNLHHYWDVEFVGALGPSATIIAQQLIAKITDAHRATWSSGTAADWAAEAYAIGKAHPYGMLPASTATNQYTLPAAYISDATAVVSEQLSKAGVRLAFVLNKAFQ